MSFFILRLTLLVYLITKIQIISAQEFAGNFCDQGNITSICYITNKRILSCFNTPIIVSGSGKLIINEGASLEYDPYCNITLSFDQLILLSMNSYIRASSITLVSDEIRINENAKILTSGLGSLQGEGKPSNEKYGGSYGGTGGREINQSGSVYFSYASYPSNVIGSITDYQSSFMFGSGTGWTRGGGRVNITAISVNIDGCIEANGENGRENTYGGGSGGTILIDCYSLSGKGYLSAVGGIGNPMNSNAYYSIGGGGGGRIFIIYEKMTFQSSESLRVWGGSSNSKSYSFIGSSGTITKLTKCNSTIIGMSVSIDNYMQKSTAATPLYIKSYTVSSIYISRASVVFSTNLLLKKSLNGFMSDVSLKSELSISFQSILLPHIDNQIKIEADSVAITKSSRIYPGLLFTVFASTFDMDTQSTLSYNQNITMYCKDYIHIDGTINEGESPYDHTLFVDAPHVSISNSVLSNKIVIIGHNQLDISGTVSSNSQDCVLTKLDNYNSTICLKYISDVEYLKEFSVVLKSPTISISTSGRVIGGTIYLCGNVITCNGAISSSMLGCTSNLGLGHGFPSLSIDFGGGGGGYGGIGGDGSEGIGGNGGLSYGNKTSPFYAGSGGGSVSLSGGAGGGLIYLNSNHLSLGSSAEISADGGEPEIYTSGGGSGGSIYIDTDTLSGQGVIHSNGGNGGSTNGGGGSGGRIYFLIRNSVNSLMLTSSSLFTSIDMETISNLSILENIQHYILLNSLPTMSYSFHTYKNKTFSTMHSILLNDQLMSSNIPIYSATGGLGGMSKDISIKPGMNGTEGTVYSSLSPCQPGYGSIFCLLCPEGTYQPDNGTSLCIPCTNAPWNGIYTSKGIITSECPYTCPEGLLKPYCLSTFDSVLYYLGGLTNFLILLSSILIIIILPIIIIYRIKQGKKLSILGCLFQRGSSKSEGITSSRSVETQFNHDISLTKSNLSSYVGRIYVEGDNTFGSSWAMPVKPPNWCLPLIFEREYDSFCKSLNPQLKWKLFSKEGILYGVLFIISPGLSYIYLHHCRKLKASIFKNFIANDTHTIFLCGTRARALQDSIKCGVDSTYCLAYIDILYMESAPIPPPLSKGYPVFPVVIGIAGRGTVTSPYHLDDHDCLVTSISLCDLFPQFIDNEWLSFIIELNILLRRIKKDKAITSCDDLASLLSPKNSLYNDLLKAGLKIHLAYSYPLVSSYETIFDYGLPMLSLYISFNNTQTTSTTTNINSTITSKVPNKINKNNSVSIRDIALNTGATFEDSEFSYDFNSAYNNRVTKHSPQTIQSQVSKYTSTNHNIGNSINSFNFDNSITIERTSSDLTRQLSNHLINQDNDSSALYERHKNINIYRPKKQDFDFTIPYPGFFIVPHTISNKYSCFIDFLKKLYSFCFSRPILPPNVNLRLSVYFILILISILDLALVAVIIAFLSTSEYIYTTMPSPIGLLLYLLPFPLCVIIAPITSLFASFILNYFYTKVAYYIELSSIFPSFLCIIVSFFFSDVNILFLLSFFSIVLKLLSTKFLLFLLTILECPRAKTINLSTPRYP